MLTVEICAHPRRGGAGLGCGRHAKDLRRLQQDHPRNEQKGQVRRVQAGLRAAAPPVPRQDSGSRLRLRVAPTGQDRDSHPPVLRRLRAHRRHGQPADRRPHRSQSPWWTERAKQHRGPLPSLQRPARRDRSERGEAGFLGARAVTPPPGHHQLGPYAASRLSLDTTIMV